MLIINQAYDINDYNDEGNSSSVVNASIRSKAAITFLFKFFCYLLNEQYAHP